MAEDKGVVMTAHALYFTEGRREEAVALMEASAQQAPRELEILNFLAFLYGTEKRYVDAIELYTRMIAINPAPIYMRNLVHCRTAAATCILDGTPINAGAPVHLDGVRV